ncbi:MAG: helicase HerA-like domain-containing protein [Nitrospirota bacterium]
MNNTEEILVARGKQDLAVHSQMANRHGLIAGATGTGKTVTLRVMAEQFSRAGVPVFMADVKGDLSGLARPGGDHPKVKERVRQLAPDDFSYEGYPVIFWDVFGVQGHPLRTTVSEMGPLLLGRILNLNDIQSGVLGLIFRIADNNGLLLLDLKDLRAMAQFAGENARQFTTEYGNISAASIGAIQRNLLLLEEQGGNALFGEPALNLHDLLQTDSSGKGMISIMSAERLIQAPKVYATFLLWILSELFEQLPEVGDPVKPKFVFFFDEAHLLFDDTPNALKEKIEQVVRLIRSKGIGVYFVTQNPLDLPDTVLGQLGNRVQHALRAFTPKDQKAVRAAAETLRANPALDAAQVITELGVGEALVSFLDVKGSPAIVERALIFPPQSRLTPLDAQERADLVRQSLLAGHYERLVDRESAYEKLKERAEQEVLQQQTKPADGKAAPKTQGRTLFEALAKSAAHAIGSQIGRQIIRGVLGSILGGRKR